MTSDSNQADPWYVYDGKKVLGPFSARGIVEYRDNVVMDKSAKVVASRAGLTKWYPLDQLEQIGAIGHSVVQSNQGNRSDLEDFVAESFRQLEELGSDSTSSDLTSKTMEVASRVEAKKLGSVSATPPLSPSGESYVIDDASETVETRKPIKRRPQFQQVQRPNSGQFQVSPKHSFMVLRGRLRLGEFRKPRDLGILLIGSVGLYSLFWFRTTARELVWHIFNKFEVSGFPPAIMAICPIYSVTMFYRLGRLVRGAEEQDGYAETSPYLAGLLGAFPPAAVFYLQRSLNRHWLRHIPGPCRT